jgi:hypothetical protein
MVKEFIGEGLRKGLITIPFSLDVKGAFDAAWWPSILMSLKDFNCPRNVYYLTKSHFSYRIAVMNTSTVKVEREVNKGNHKDLAADQDFGISNTTYFLI